VDNRTTLAAITRTGRSTAARATKALNADVFAQTGLDDDDQDALIRVLTALRAAAGDFTP
jgi:hypothetical protein